MDRPSTTISLTLLAISWLLAAPFAQAAEKLLGAKPPEWEVTDWIHSKPLTLEGLRGKVVLIRWWTAPDCPYCAATAPALNELHETFKARGLVVLGFYHHKARGPLEIESVKGHANKFGFQFPVAVDRDWKTLRGWWLDDSKKDWTSVSFLLDRHGVIRHIHPGGKYTPGDDSFRALKSKIEELLSEK